MTGQVVCIGDVMIDVLARLDESPGEIRHGSDSPATITVFSGGSAANTAAWLARGAALTTPPRFVGRVGDDTFGRLAIAELQAGGVQTDVVIDADEPTGVCIVLLSPDGERTMIPSAGANLHLSLDQAASLDLRRGQRCHLSGYTLMRDRSRAAARAALHQATDAGVPVSVDVSSAGPLQRMGAKTFLSLVPADALLLANEAEAQVLTGLRDPELAAAQLVERFATVVIKCGGQGAVWARGNQVARVAAQPTEILDSTGAGDAFAAGMLSALLQDAEINEAVANGNRLGALAIGRLGARPATG